MATVSITEILGSDNIAGSRVTINSNFSNLATAINTIQTNVDTSFTPGGKLTVGSSLIKKYTNPVTSQIFTCEASGLFSGNLTVSKVLSVTESSNVGTDLTVAGNVTFNNTATGTGSFACSLPISLNSAFINPSLAGTTGPGVLFLNPQVLPQNPSATVRGITGSLSGVSVIRLNFGSYTAGAAASSCHTVNLPAASSYPGQVLSVIIDTPSSYTGAVFGIGTATLAAGYTSQGILFCGLTGVNGFTGSPFVDSNSLAIRKSAVTLYADTSIGGWRVLSATPYVAY